MRVFVLVLAAAGLVAAPLFATTPARTGGGFHFLLAKSLAEEGRIREALAELELAREAAGTEPYLLLEGAALQMQLGNLAEAMATVARARLLLPDDLDVLRLQGRIALARSEEDPAAVDVAREALEQLLEARPDDLEVLLSLGQIYLSNGLAHRAVEMLDEASRLRPNHPWIESMRARALAAAGEADSADRVQRAALERHPDDLIIRLELVDRLGLKGQHQEALELLRAAPESQHGRHDFREREAREVFLAGDPEAALRRIETVVEETGSRIGPRMLLARIRLALGYFDAAVEALDGLPANLNLAGAIELRARALEGSGHFGAAAELLQSTLATDGEGGDAEFEVTTGMEIARLWGRAGEWDRAVAAARTARKSARGRTVEALRRVEARSLVAAGRPDQALALVGGGESMTIEQATMRIDILVGASRIEEARVEAAALLERSPGALLAVAGSFQDRGLFEIALPMLERAFAAEPESLEAIFRLATCYERLNRRGEAIPLLQGLVRRAPGFSPALNYLGYLWIERGENLDEALRLVSAAVRLQPDNGAYVDSLGWGEYQLGSYERAVALLERASRLQPRDATILEHLGDARAAGGDSAGALEAYRRALDLEPATAAELEEKISRLDGKY